MLYFTRLHSNTVRSLIITLLQIFCKNFETLSTFVKEMDKSLVACCLGSWCIYRTMPSYRREKLSLPFCYCFDVLVGLCWICSSMTKHINCC